MVKDNRLTSSIILQKTDSSWKYSQYKRSQRKEFEKACSFSATEEGHVSQDIETKNSTITQRRSRTTMFSAKGV